MLRHIDGFDQYQGQSGQDLLTALTSSGYTVSSGLGMADGRKPGTYALELQVAAGTAGDSWSSRTNNVKQNLYGIAVSSTTGRYVAVGDNGVAVGSDDGITMLPVVLGVSAHMRDIQVSGATWIAVGLGSTIMRSTDGRNFGVRPAPASGISLYAVATDGAGTWVAVGANGAVGAIFVSTDDGVNWVSIAADIAGARAHNCVAWKNGVWVLGGLNGRIMTSTDAITFANRVSGTTNNIMAAECGSNGHWLVAAGSDVRRSIDGGVTWALATAAIMGGSIQDLAFADGRWIAVGTNGNVRMTDDEDVWTTPSITGIGTTQLNDVFALRGSNRGWAVVGNLNAAISTPSARTAVIYVSLAPPTRVTRTFPAAGEKITVGWAHYASTRGRILSVTDVLDMDWPSHIEMGGQAGIAIPARNVWYYYELTIDKVNKTATLHINDTLDVTCAISDAAALMTEYEFTWIAENGAVARLDDVYMVDDQTPNAEQLVDRIGPITIPLRLPTADQGTNNWTPASGGTHWNQVGLLPPSEESYVRSAVSGAQDLFTSSTPLPDGPIIAVGVLALAMKGDIDNRQLGLVVGAPGPTQKEIVDSTLSVVPEYSYAVFEKAPGNVAWDAANTANTPFGVVVRP